MKIGIFVWNVPGAAIFVRVARALPSMVFSKILTNSLEYAQTVRFT